MTFTKEQIRDIKDYIYAQDELTEECIDFTAPLVARAMIELNIQVDWLGTIIEPTVEDYLDSDVPNEYLLGTTEFEKDQMFKYIVGIS